MKKASFYLTAFAACLIGMAGIEFYFKVALAQEKFRIEAHAHRAICESECNRPDPGFALLGCTTHAESREMNHDLPPIVLMMGSGCMYLGNQVKGITP